MLKHSVQSSNQPLLIDKREREEHLFVE